MSESTLLEPTTAPDPLASLRNREREQAQSGNASGPRPSPSTRRSSTAPPTTRPSPATPIGSPTWPRYWR